MGFVRTERKVNTKKAKLTHDVKWIRTALSYPPREDWRRLLKPTDAAGCKAFQAECEKKPHHATCRINKNWFCGEVGLPTLPMVEVMEDHLNTEDLKRMREDIIT